MYSEPQYVCSKVFHLITNQIHQQKHEQPCKCSVYFRFLSHTTCAYFSCSIEKTFSYFYYTPSEEKRNCQVMSDTNGCSNWQHLALISSFPLSISLVNVTKFAGNSGFGHIYWKKSLMENFIICQKGLVLTHNIFENRQMFENIFALYSKVVSVLHWKLQFFALHVSCRTVFPNIHISFWWRTNILKCFSFIFKSFLLK